MPVCSSTDTQTEVERGAWNGSCRFKTVLTELETSSHPSDQTVEPGPSARAVIILVAWPGEWSQDIFYLDDMGAALAKLSPRS